MVGEGWGLEIVLGKGLQSAQLVVCRWVYMCVSIYSVCICVFVCVISCTCVFVYMHICECLYVLLNVCESVCGMQESFFLQARSPGGWCKMSEDLMTHS